MVKTLKEIKEYKKQVVSLYKISKGCCICGYNKNPRNLCFDHLPDFQKSEVVKNGNGKNNGGGMHNLIIQGTTEELISEIKKCQILCVPCHAEKTYKNVTRIDETNDRINTIEELENRIFSFEKS
jgi:hypothetical protein